MEVTYYCYEDIYVHCACNQDLVLATGVYPICTFSMENGEKKIFKRKRPLFDYSQTAKEKKKKENPHNW